MIAWFTSAHLIQSEQVSQLKYGRSTGSESNMNWSPCHPVGVRGGGSGWSPLMASIPSVAPADCKR